MKKPITIKDIAQKLNISTATVSRALRDSKEISKETKKAVLSLAKEMDYHPNLLARGLINRKSKILGVIVPTINRQFWSNAISGIENIAFEDDYKVMIFQSSESFQKEVEIVETLANSRVDGILIAFSKETQDFDHIKQIQERGIPLVLFERASDVPNISKVITDDLLGGKIITRHLIESGKKRIAYIGGPLSLKVCRDRFLGYKTAMEEAGLKILPEHIIQTEEFTFQSAREELKKIWSLNQKPDAIVCFADILAIGIIDACKEMGVKVPDELAVTGFGNDDTGQFISPKLTTMAQPSFEMGQLAARLILEEIDSDDKHELKKIEIIKPSLIERESS